MEILAVIIFAINLPAGGEYSAGRPQVREDDWYQGKINGTFSIFLILEDDVKRYLVNFCGLISSIEYGTLGCGGGKK